MLRKCLFHIPLLLSIFALFQAIDANECLAIESFQNAQYEVIYHSNFNPLKKSYGKSAEDGIKFIKLMLNDYAKVLHEEINIAPKEHYLLWKNDGIGVKLVLSTFNESLLYFFPNEKNQIFVEGINFPVQTALLYGFIDLNKPKDEIDLRKLSLKVPFDDAVNQYKAQEGRIIFTDSGGWFFIVGKGGLVFNNVDKMFKFYQKTIAGVLTGVLKINNSTQYFIKIHGHADSFKFNLEGPLLFSSTNTFSWAFDTASKLGKEFAELEIKEHFTKSKFFLLSLAHKKLAPKAEEILKKKSRSEKERSFEYPLWKFKRDVCELKKMAQHENIDVAYIDELLACKALQPADGHLFWYYQNSVGFMWQWLLVNCVVLFILLLLRSITHQKKQVFININRKLISIGGKASFVILLFAINGWIFQKKPEAVTVIYWILPGAALIACLLCYHNLNSVTKRYYDTTGISND